MGWESTCTPRERVTERVSGNHGLAKSCIVSEKKQDGSKYNDMHDDNTALKTEEEESEVKELVVIGSGPHALSLVLRLLEPDADLLSDNDRHKKAEFQSRQRSVSAVKNHIKKLSRGPAHTLKRSKKKSKPSSTKVDLDDDDVPPPLSLESIRNDVLVVDKSGDWLANWKHNFDAIEIPKLRSLMNAHCDPYDHRALEYYAEYMNNRGDELICVPELCKNKKRFKGPYQVPTTSLFLDFHDLLVKSYGIEDIVRKGTVKSVTPIQGQDNVTPLFQLIIEFDLGSTVKQIKVKTKRVVCAMGPIFNTEEAFWEATLKRDLDGTPDKYPSNRILHPPEIVPYLKSRNKQQETINRLLIVGGGITSAQLALLAAKSSWCNHCKLIQRSKILSRHFDVETKWMGHRRGKLLEHFWSMPFEERANFLKEARRGGSIPPEILHELSLCEEQQIGLEVQEEVQISQVQWRNGSLHVTLDDGSDPEDYDMIWLATGAENHVDFYPVFSCLRKALPIDVVNGLPVLSEQLAWCSCSNSKTNEAEWKRMARKRFWCMGAMAGLQLGPDALNLVGARQGAVRIAQDIRLDMKSAH